MHLSPHKPCQDLKSKFTRTSTRADSDVFTKFVTLHMANLDHTNNYDKMLCDQAKLAGTHKFCFYCCANLQLLLFQELSTQQFSWGSLLKVALKIQLNRKLKKKMSDFSLILPDCITNSDQWPLLKKFFWCENEIEGSQSQICFDCIF